MMGRSVWGWRQGVRQCRDDPSLVCAAFSPYSAHGSTLLIPGGLNVKYPSRAHVFQHLVPDGDTVWEGHGTFQRWNFAEGSRSLGAGLEATWLFVDALLTSQPPAPATLTSPLK